MSVNTAPNTQQAHQVEATFKNYDASQAQRYANYRPSYDPRLIDLIVRTHTATGGQLHKVLDIGCGPGIATRQIAGYFQEVDGIDAGASMIEMAKTTPCFSATGAQASFQVCNSEEIDKVFKPESVDMITVATAAHWFDMPRFYVAASKVLKPGGTIAIWGGGGWFLDPKTTPNAEKVQNLWTKLETEILLPYEMPGNKLSRELLVDLGLPWTIETNDPEVKAALDKFDKEKSMRREFNKDGKPDPDPMLKDTHGYLNYRRINLDMVSKIIGTASQVTRWRAAHKDQLEKGEIEDCIERMVRLSREEMTRDPAFKDRDWADSIVAAVLIMVKKKA